MDKEEFLEKLHTEYYDRTAPDIARKMFDFSLTKDERLKFHKEYRKAKEEKVQEFKKDALEVLKLTDHLKADKLFDIAWDYGHSSGCKEVFYYMEDLSALLK